MMRSTYPKGNINHLGSLITVQGKSLKLCTQKKVEFIHNNHIQLLTKTRNKHAKACLLSNDLAVSQLISKEQGNAATRQEVQQ